MTTDKEYVYMIHLREHINKNEPVYKIGKTKQENTTRFSNYPKGSRLLLQIICSNCHNIEKEIIKLFKEKYIHRKEDYGNEYFEGNYKFMIKDIFNLIYEDNEIVVSSNTYKLIDKLFDEEKKIIDSFNNYQKKSHLRSSSLTKDEIKPYLDCLKQKRYDDYEDWCIIGLSLFNMDYRNFDLWKMWSSQSAKYNEDACYKKWCKEFPKDINSNLGFNKIKEMAKIDNFEKFIAIININKKYFFQRWIQAHIDEKDIYPKSISISTITHYIHSYIIDYASFNIACVLPGGTSSIYYKFDKHKHKWIEDKAANKVYTLLSNTIKNELSDIYLEIKEQIIAAQRLENEQSKSLNTGDSSDEKITHSMPEEQNNKICSMIIQFLDKPSNKNIIIEDLSQKFYDENFYKKLDVNNNIFVCNNGVLDLDLCIFRDGKPSDMMSISSNIDFPKNIDLMEAQDYMYAIQEWLDKIFPDDQVQEYIMNVMSCKLSGNLGLLGERFHIFTGSGSNGKTEFFKLISETFGNYYINLDKKKLYDKPIRDLNEINPYITILKAKRLIMIPESINNFPFENDKLNDLISADPLTYYHLNKEIIQFIPQHSVFLKCNDIPITEIISDGFLDKILIIPCESKFISKDLHKLTDSRKFPNHFRATEQTHFYNDWAPYFLFMLFRRYKDLKTNNFKFPIPDKINAATRQYQEEASPYIQFYNDKIEEASGYKVAAATLYQEFQQFVGRDFKTQKPIFLKQMERMIGKPRGEKKDFYGFRIFGTEGEKIENPE